MPTPTDTVTLTRAGYAALVEHYRAALDAIAACDRYDPRPTACDGMEGDVQGSYVRWDDVAAILDRVGVPADA